jgi:hypothetical protein
MQRSAEADDSGGRLVLEHSPDGNEPWTVQANDPWSVDHFWGYDGDFGPGYLRGYEIGNGTTLAGNSPYSEPLAQGPY